MRSRPTVAKMILTTLLCFAIAACTSKPKPTDMPVSYMGETWEQGEVKTCLQESFKGENSPVLLCSVSAGAAFYMTAGMMDKATDEKTRSDLREVFYAKTKVFPVTFEDPIQFRDSSGKPMGAWECRKTDADIRCKAPKRKQ
jgi:hypothetical protein